MLRNFEIFVHYSHYSNCKLPNFQIYFVIGIWSNFTICDNTVREGRVLAVDCIKSQPVWMSEMKEYIGSIPLHALMIPGTHNSGSWDEFKSYTDDTVLMRFSVNQGEAVWNQLLLGVRLSNMTLFQPVIILLSDTSTCVSVITTTLRKSFGSFMTLSNRIRSTKPFKLSRGSSG